MRDTYIFAMVNFLLCLAIGIVSICRLNNMHGRVLQRVRSEYAAYVGAAVASATQPWYGEWPGWASIAMAAAMLAGLIFSSHAWRNGPPPSTKLGDL